MSYSDYSVASLDRLWDITDSYFDIPKMRKMYQIKVYADCVAIHDLDKLTTRKLTEGERALVLEEFPGLKEPDCVSVFTDAVESITM